MKKCVFSLLRSTVIACCLLLVACGYQWQGFDSPGTNSVLGDGGKTLRIAEVEQTTLYNWLVPYVRSRMRDELQLRQLATMVDSGDSDYTMHIRLPYFRIYSFISDDDDQTLLSNATSSMEVEIQDAQGNIVWRSGAVNYNERYEASSEEIAVREVVTQLIARVADRFQQNF